MRGSALALLVPLAVFAAGPALAKGPPAPPAAATLVADSPTSTSPLVHFTGANYAPDTRILTSIDGPDGARSAYVQVGTSSHSGGVSFTLDLQSTTLGVYTVTAYEYRNQAHITERASTTVELVAAP